MSALKRGKTESYEEARSASSKKSHVEIAAGVELRDYLIDDFIAGALNNTQIASIADMHQRNGGTGLESLAVPSSSHNATSVAKKYIQAI